MSRGISSRTVQAPDTGITLQHGHTLPSLVSTHPSGPWSSQTSCARWGRQAGSGRRVTGQMAAPQTPPTLSVLSEVAIRAAAGKIHR